MSRLGQFRPPPLRKCRQCGAEIPRHAYHRNHCRVCQTAKARVTRLRRDRLGDTPRAYCWLGHLLKPGANPSDCHCCERMANLEAEQALAVEAERLRRGLYTDAEIAALIDRHDAEVWNIA